MNNDEYEKEAWVGLDSFTASIRHMLETSLRSSTILFGDLYHDDHHHFHGGDTHDDVDYGSVEDLESIQLSFHFALVCAEFMLVLLIFLHRTKIGAQYVSS